MTTNRSYTAKKRKINVFTLKKLLFFDSYVVNLGYPGIPGTFFLNSRYFPEPGITNIREFPQP